MINWYDVKFTNEKSVTIAGTEVHCARAIIPGARFEPIIGVDPGRKFGIAWTKGDAIIALWGELEQQKPQWLVGIDAYDFVRKLHKHYFFFEGDPLRAVVEGAIYKPKGAQGVSYGEANLAYIRFGFLLGLRRSGVPSELMPVMTIRKRAFDDGRQKARDFWPTLNLNASDAVGCALAGQIE